MKPIEIQTKKVLGLLVRTCNADEMQASTARFGPLWKDFAATVAPSLPLTAQVLGVYYRYASDAHGAFERNGPEGKIEIFIAVVQP